MALYERITFLIVAGTLGLFLLAFLFGIWGAFLTIYPGFPKAVARAISTIETQAKAAYASVRELYGRALEAIPQGGLHARS